MWPGPPSAWATWPSTARTSTGSRGAPPSGGATSSSASRPDGEATDVTPPPANARTRVHEYGGGDFAVAGGRLVYSEFADQRLYLLDLRQQQQGPDGPPRPLTESSQHPRRPRPALRRRHLRLRPESPDLRPRRPPRAPPARPPPTRPAGSSPRPPPPAPERHRRRRPRPPPEAPGPRRRAAGARLRERLLRLAPPQPGRPAPGLADLEPPQHALGRLRAVDGPPHPGGRRPGRPARRRRAPGIDLPARVGAGRAPLLRLRPQRVVEPLPPRLGARRRPRLAGATGRRAAGRARTLAPRAAEFGQPQWVFGAATYGFLSPVSALVCAFAEEGTWRLGRLDLPASRLEVIPLPYTDIRSLRPLPDGGVVLNAGAPDQPPALVRVDPQTGRHDVLRRSSEVRVDPAYLSAPRAVAFPTTGGQTAHAFYYPPANRDAQAPPGDLPPLLVKSHGGPTSATSSALTLGTQYWTSRGVAVLDVNYGGSTGYGREYRRRLDGRWGVVDVDDCVNGALALAARGGGRSPAPAHHRGQRRRLHHPLRPGLPRRLPRRGEPLRRQRPGGPGPGHAQVRVALPRPPDRPLPGPARPLPGPLPHPPPPGPRLPHHLLPGPGGRRRAPGPDGDDGGRPAPEGRPRGLPPLRGEQHGFRSAANIARALDAEHYFYARVLGLPLPEGVEPVPIENLPDP